MERILGGEEAREQSIRGPCGRRRNRRLLDPFGPGDVEPSQHIKQRDTRGDRRQHGGGVVSGPRLPDLRRNGRGADAVRFDDQAQEAEDGNGGNGFEHGRHAQDWDQQRPAETQTAVDPAQDRAQVV